MKIDFFSLRLNYFQNCGVNVKFTESPLDSKSLYQKYVLQKLSLRWN